MKNYYSELYERARATLKGNIYSCETFGNKKMIVPSVETYKGVWNWDSAFIALTVSRWDVELALEQCDLFFEKINANGMLPDAVLANGVIFNNACKPPIFAWVLPKILERANSSKQKYIKYFELLKLNLNFWENERKFGDLFHYDAKLGEFRDRDSKNESGWDTSVRWDKNGAYCLWTVDLNCYMVMFYEAMAVMAKKSGNDDMVDYYNEKGKDLRVCIEKYLWNEKVKCYCDFDYLRNEFSDVISPAAFMPLFIKNSSESRAIRMAELAENKEYFYPYIPTVSYNNPAFCSYDFWRGPSWLNVDYFVIEGLKNSGYKELSHKLRMNILEMCDRDKRSIFEYYDAMSGKGLGAEGFGWSSSMIIELIENNL